MLRLNETRSKLLRRARWAADLSALLILFAMLIGFGVGVNASLMRVRPPQSKNTPAPSAPIRPISVSVVNFEELAAHDDKARKETFAGAATIASASSITKSSNSLKTDRSLFTTARNFSSVKPAFLPTAELMSTQNGQPTRDAVRTFPN
jgi:hypothetical protein